jgi:hypothetical protein
MKQILLQVNYLPSLSVPLTNPTRTWQLHIVVRILHGGFTQPGKTV